ncbi:restriction endonuclease subunit S [Thermococcus sp.]|uniref:restriction endonuclease subunit S n=1 Tax=Thermococcus sp. TaxID=35749 RepID=UPI00260AC6E8|nr:restriction endonuclease subunit S [Thermococcus sp.]
MKTLDEFLNKQYHTKTPAKGSAVLQKERKKLYGRELPEGWEIVKLRDIFTPVDMKSRRIRVQDNTKYMLISASLYSKGIKFREWKFGREIKTKTMYIVHAGDFIFSKIRAKQGAYGFIPPQLEGAIVSNEYPILKLNQKVALQEFIEYYLSQPIMWGLFGQYSRGLKDKSRTKVNEFLEVKIALPPLEEQRKIVYILKTVQRAIEQQEKIIKTTKELKRALMKRLFTKGLDPNQPTKMTEIGEIPEHWGILRLGDIGELQYGYTSSAISINTGVKFLRITDINEDYRINWEDVPYCYISDREYPKYALRIGDIVFARIGATAGKTGFIKENIKAVFASYLIRFRTKSSKILSEFLFYYTHSERYWRFIKKEREDKLKKGINASILSNLPVPIPPLEEQRKIANILLTVDKKIELAQQKRKALEELFSTLRHKLMTGQIRVSNLKTPTE